MLIQCLICIVNHTVVEKHIVSDAKWNQGVTFTIENKSAHLPCSMRSSSGFGQGGSPCVRGLALESKKHRSLPPPLLSSAGPLRKMLSWRCSLGLALCQVTQFSFSGYSVEDQFGYLKTGNKTFLLLLLPISNCLIWFKSLFIPVHVDEYVCVCFPAFYGTLVEIIEQLFGVNYSSHHKDLG